uniref:AP-1 complex subunit gamma n=1 Tax=Arcella intermedia TaxID=1963864 RepID=A0A6B2KXH5_9EUKA
MRDLIRHVRECKTSAEEREVLSKEAALIRTAFSKGSENRPRNIAKLLYMNMLGHPTHWGQMECVKSVATAGFTDKRIGYLGLNILLDENQEVLMLATHSMKTDLLHANQYIAGLALSTMGNIASEQICRDCAPEIEQLLSSPNPYIQKKAVLCAVKIVRKTPDLADQFKGKIKDLLNEKDHAVLISTITLMIELCKISDEFRDFFRQKLLITVIKILKNLATAGYAPEYDVGAITDPFLQVRILGLLRILGTGDATASERMNEVLAQIATNTDPGRNVGNSILYECVNTIMSIECETELRVIAINTLAKFLSNKDNNIRYVALFTFCKVVDKDTEAVQRHKSTILACLKDPDVSIKRRALHLLYALVNSSNVKGLVKELLDFLVVADLEFRAETTAKLCYLADKYSPSNRWYFDTMLRILTLSGDHVPDDVRASLINTISRDEGLHVYAVHRIYSELSQELSQQGLNQVGAWCIGEFGDYLLNKVPDEGAVQTTPENIVALLYKLLNTVTTTTESKKFVLTALLKLSARLGSSTDQQIKNIIASYQANTNLDLQQRAGEYLQFWNWDPSIRSQLLARIPPLPLQQSQEGQEARSSINIPKEVVSTRPASVPGTLIDPFASDPFAPPSTVPVSSAQELTQILTNPAPPVEVQPGSFSAASIMSLFETIQPTPAPAMIPGLVSPMTPFPTPIGPGLVPGLPATIPGLSPMPAIPGLTPILPAASPLPGLGVFGAPLAPLPQPAADPSPFPAMVAFQNNEIQILFSFKKPNPAALQYTLITATISNISLYPIAEILLQAAPPKHVKYNIDPLPDNTIQAGGSVNLAIKASNAAQGQKPLMMKIRLSYSINNTKRELEHVCKDFPSEI